MQEQLARVRNNDVRSVGRNAGTLCALRRNRSGLPSRQVLYKGSRSVVGFVSGEQNSPAIREPLSGFIMHSFGGEPLRFSRAGWKQNELRTVRIAANAHNPLPIRR